MPDGIGRPGSSCLVLRMSSVLRAWWVPEGVRIVTPKYESIRIDFYEDIRRECLYGHTP